MYWVETTEEPGRLGLRHPHLVLQEDVLNHSRIHSVVVCALTTNLAKAREPGNVLLDPGEGNLPNASVVVVSQISAVDKAKLGEHIGRLSAERVRRALAGLAFQQRCSSRPGGGEARDE